MTDTHVPNRRQRRAQAIAALVLLALIGFLCLSVEWLVQTTPAVAVGISAALFLIWLAVRR